MKIVVEKQALVWKRRYETVTVIPWGNNALRVRATKNPGFTEDCWALEEPVPNEVDSVAVDKTEDGGAFITNGRLRAQVDANGIITFYRDGQKILKEYHRDYDQPSCKESRC